MSEKIDRVEALADQAERYFWEAYATEGSVGSVITQGANDVCWDMCDAAHPLLDDVLKGFSDVCGVEYVPLGDAASDPVWEIDGDLAPTRSMYLPVVQALCASLRTKVTELQAYDTTAHESTVRTAYVAAMAEIVAHVRTCINEMGPLWPRVICPRYPAVNAEGSVIGVSGLQDYVYPTAIEVVSESTRWMSIRLKMGEYTLNPLNFGLGERFQPENSATQAGIVRRNGGFIYVKFPDVDGSPSEYNGVYEIMYILSTGELYLRPTSYYVGFANGEFSEPIEGSDFLIRAIRRAEDIMGDDFVCVEYEAPTSLVANPDQVWQYIFDGTKPNSHYTPVLSGGSWQRYDNNIPGAIYHATIPHLIENVSVDTLFVTDVAVPEITDFTNGGVYAIAVDSGTSKVVVGGSFSVAKNSPVGNIVVYNDDGTIDATFVAGSGTGFNGPVYCVAVYDGYYYVGGKFSEYNGDPAYNLVRLDDEGVMDPTFMPVMNDAVWTICTGVDSDYIVVGGDFITVNSMPTERIARIAINTSPGALVPGLSFVSPNDRVRKIVYNSTTGYLYLAGLFTQATGVTCYGLCVIEASTGTWPIVVSPPGFAFDPLNPDAPKTSNHVHDVCVNSSGLFIVGGMAYTSGGIYTTDGKVRRVNAASGLFDYEGDPESNINSHVIANFNSTVCIMGGAYNVSGAADKNILLLAADADIDQSLACHWGASIYAIAVNGGDVYVGGQFDSVGGQPRKNLVRLAVTVGSPSTMAVDSGFV